MSKPNYFSYFPNNEYAIESDHAGNLTMLEVKDFFHLLKVREDIFSENTLYTKYFVQNGDRPDQVSYKVYGDESYYWLVLQVNDIVDYYNEWPLSSTEFEEFMLNKYGSWEGAHDTHHWETVETRDAYGNLMLPKGLIVSEDFQYEIPFDREDDDRKVSYPREVSNWEYEQKLNEEKSQISILREEYLYDVLRDLKNYARNLKVRSSELSYDSIFKG